MRNLLLVFFLSFFSFLATAQQDKYVYHEVKSGDTKYSISKNYGVTIEELEKFNPDIKSGLKPGMVLLIPKKEAESKPATSGESEKFKRHKVEQGQTLYSISQQYQVSIEDIKKINPELKEGLKAGQELLIPLRPKPADKPATPTGDYKEHQVEAGETLYSLALKYGVPIPEIKKINPELAEEGLKAGDILRIPTKVQPEKEAGAEDKARLAAEIARAKDERKATDRLKSPEALEYTSGQYHIHKVEARETAYSISKKYQISLDSLYLLNPGAETGLRIGQLLKLPLNRSKYSDQNLVQNKEPEEELASDAPSPQTEPEDTTSGFFLYQVKTGDSFYSLQNRFNVSREELLKLNPEVQSGLTVDQYIIIPKKKDEVDVTWLDKIFKNVETQDQPMGTPEKEKLSRKDSLNKGAEPLVKPVEVLEDTLEIDVNRTYRVGVLLPFMAGTDTSFNYDLEVPQRSHYVLDFYNGLLMAADTLAAQGMNVNLHVYDTKNSLYTLGEKMEEIKAARYDMLIGPLFQKTVEYVADELKQSQTPVISPLSKTVDVTNRPNLVKCVPDATAGAQEIADLINSNYINARIIFAHSNTTEEREKMKQIKARLLARSEDTSFVKSVVNTEGVVARSELTDVMAEGKANVVIVLTEDKVFLSDLISKLSSMHSKQIAVIGPSRLMQIPTLEMSYLNNLRLTMTDPSYINYTDQGTSDFIKRYRQRYGNEPSQFAFQGYDVGFYFLNKLWKSGPYLLQTIGEEQQLLNTGFRITKSEKGGYENQFMHVLGIRDFTLVKITPQSPEKASAQ